MRHHRADQSPRPEGCQHVLQERQVRLLPWFGTESVREPLRKLDTLLGVVLREGPICHDAVEPRQLAAFAVHRLGESVAVLRIGVGNSVQDHLHLRDGPVPCSGRRPRCGAARLGGAPSAPPAARTRRPLLTRAATSAGTGSRRSRRCAWGIPVPPERPTEAFTRPHERGTRCLVALDPRRATACSRRTPNRGTSRASWAAAEEQASRSARPRARPVPGRARSAAEAPAEREHGRRRTSLSL